MMSRSPFGSTCRTGGDGCCAAFAVGGDAAGAALSADLPAGVAAHPAAISAATTASVRAPCRRRAGKTDVAAPSHGGTAESRTRAGNGRQGHAANLSGGIEDSPHMGMAAPEIEAAASDARNAI